LSDLLDLEASVYLILGDNIGTCVTAAIASVGGKLASKRLALGHALFNVIGTVIVFPFIPLYLRYVSPFSRPTWPGRLQPPTPSSTS
jgi:phosphate:Na+ symporter